MRAKNLGLTALAGTLALACAPASAQIEAATPVPDEASPAAASALSQVVVTANRAETPASEVGQSFTVLTAADLTRDQETSVADILDRTPGLTVARNGGPGETTAVFIRGGDSAQTVALIDGVKVNDPSSPSAGYDFANVLSGDFARVEVLRGPQSTLYGSEAIGGVVNIITTASTRQLQGSLRLEGGDFGTSYLTAALGGERSGSDWRLAAYDEATKSAPCFDRAFGGSRPCAYHTRGFSGRLTQEIIPALQVDERLYYTRSRTDFDGYDTPTGGYGDDKEYGVTQQTVDYTGFNLSLFDGRLKNRLAYEYSAIDRNSQDPDQPKNYGADTTATFLAAGRTQTAEYEGVLALAPQWRGVFGAQTERSSLVAFSPLYDSEPDRAHQTIQSGYAQLTTEPAPGLTATGGLRYDEQSRVGGHATGQASAAWRLNEGATIVRASFGQGFKAPSLYELYSQYGNVALKPEQANGWDAGIEQHFFDGHVAFQATYFGRDTRNLIDYVSCYEIQSSVCARHPSGYYANIDRTGAQGAELQASWRVSAALDFAANATFDDVEDRSPGAATLGRQLARRPKTTANFTAGYIWPVGLRSDLALRYAGESFDDAAHTIALKSYTLIDLRASYPLRPHLEVYGRIENLTNAHYETVYQYGTLGRAAYAGARLSF